ncbi:hypothetical protein EQ845_12365 [Pseudomonas putida]|uniref:SprT family zinc-dependent metalloprotease n=1 Tax=Pseudomonas putida TaxID=303 RepID=UPI00117A8CAE|nr:SprT-like domain-containing protein [Pseudomonas putida]TRO35235.1 hypothetical protein EQ845_12365 [Pseudomonas putida]
MLPVDELKAVRARVTECLGLAASHLSRDIPEIPVLFNLTGKSGGMFRYRKDKRTGRCYDLQFRFNRILARENLSEYLDQICPHEVAHYVTHLVWGAEVDPHGAEWTQIMVEVFKVQADRCHQLDTSRAVKREFLYQCGCEGRTFRLSTKRHNRMVRRTALYNCNACGQLLAFIREADKAAAQVISKLFISTSGPAIDSAQADRIAKLIIDHQVNQVVIDCLITGERHRQLLSKKLNVPLASVTRHPTPDTLPGGVTHAIVFGDGQDERQGRVAKAFEQRGVKVRMVRAGVG